MNSCVNKLSRKNSTEKILSTFKYLTPDCLLCFMRGQNLGLLKLEILLKLNLSTIENIGFKF
jgi:hypothetical protein